MRPLRTPSLTGARFLSSTSSAGSGRPETQPSPARHDDLHFQRTHASSDAARAARDCPLARRRSARGVKLRFPSGGIMFASSPRQDPAPKSRAGAYRPQPFDALQDNTAPHLSKAAEDFHSLRRVARVLYGSGFAILFSTRRRSNAGPTRPQLGTDRLTSGAANIQRGTCSSPAVCRATRRQPRQNVRHRPSLRAPRQL